MSEKVIKGIWAPEPMREGEYQQGYIVGMDALSGHHKVTRITYRSQFHGDHDVGWFDVFALVKDEEELLASMNERHVAEIQYAVDP